jgi:hypothetical protein
VEADPSAQRPHLRVPRLGHLGYADSSHGLWSWAPGTCRPLTARARRAGPLAIALGHPLGGSGTKLLTTLVNQLEATGGRYGLQTMRDGGLMANATIIERL